MLKKLLSLIILLSAALIWGFAFVAQGQSANIPAFTLGAVRSWLGAFFLVALILILDPALKTGRRLFSRRGIDLNLYEIIGGAICGAVLAVASALQQIGINNNTSPGKAAFITALYVVLVPIYALTLKKRAPLNVWLAVAISALGFYLLCIKDNFSIAPSDIYVILCALIFPVHILVIDRFSPMCDGVRMSSVQFFTAAIINTAVALIFERPIAFTEIGNAILPVLYLGICSSGIAYTLQIIGQRGVNPTCATIVLSLESVFGVIGSALILKSAMLPREYAGCAIVLLAVLLSQIDIPSLIKAHKINKSKK